MTVHSKLRLTRIDLNKVQNHFLAGSIVNLAGIANNHPGLR